MRVKRKIFQTVEIGNESSSPPLAHTLFVTQ